MSVKTPLGLILTLFTLAFGNDLKAQESLQQIPQIEWQSLPYDTAHEGETFGPMMWSPDSAYVAGIDFSLNEFVVFSIAESRLIRRMPLPNWDRQRNLFASARWSPNGAYFALALGEQAYIIDAQTGELISQLDQASNPDPYLGIVDVRWSNDSVSVAALSWKGFITVFNASSGEATLTIDLVPEGRGGLAYPMFDWSPDNRYFAAVYQDDSIAVWDSQGNLLTTMPESQNCVGGFAEYYQTGSTMSWASDNQTLLVSGFSLVRCRFNGTVLERIGKIITYQPDPDSDPYQFGSAAWSPDGRWIVGVLPVLDPSSPYHCQLQFFDVQQDMQVTRIDEDKCSMVVWSPDGNYIGSNNLTIGRIIDRP